MQRKEQASTSFDPAHNSKGFLARLLSWVTATQLYDDVLELSSRPLFVVVGVAVIESEGEPEEAGVNVVAVAECRCDARFTMGSCTGEPSNSAQPPRRPISTTRSRIRPSSSFLERNEIEKLVCVRGIVQQKCMKSVEISGRGAIIIMMMIKSIQRLTSAFLPFAPPQTAPPMC